MKAGIKVTYTDGSTESVTAIVADFVAWERHTGRKASDLSAGVGIEDMALLAWSAATRGQNIPFEDWLQTVADLDEVADAAPKVTRKVASKGS